MYAMRVLGELGRCIESLTIAVDGDEIAEALALRDRLDAKLSEALGAFDRAELWDLDAATSLTAWLRDRGKLTGKQAASTARVAKRLWELPVTSEAWADGALSGGQVQAVVANLNDAVAPLFSDHEAAVVPTLVRLGVAETATAMQAWRAMADAVVEPQPTEEPERSLHLSRTLDGRGELTGSLDPLGTEVLDTALRLATTSDGADGDACRRPAQRRADALVDVARFFLDHQDHVPAGRHRPHVSLVTLGGGERHGGVPWIVGGAPVDQASFDAACCDGTANRVLADTRGVVVQLTAAARTVPTALFNALVLRDGHCRHPGCDRPASWCEAHHVVPWHESGPTTLANLVLKCSRHHHRAHQRGWSEVLEPDGTLHITDPNGTTRTTRPPGLLALAG